MGNYKNFVFESKSTGIVPVLLALIGFLVYLVLSFAPLAFLGWIIYHFASKYW